MHDNGEKVGIGGAVSPQRDEHRVRYLGDRLGSSFCLVE